MTCKLTIALGALGALLITLPAGAETPRPTTPTKPAKPGTSTMPLIVAPAWLAANLDAPDLVLLHVGEPDAYRSAHIRGARLVSLGDVALGAEHDEHMHLELPPPEELRTRLAALGISNRSRVVVYFGQDWVSSTTRVILTLDAAGLGSQVSLLDGGMPAWQRAGHPVTDVVPAAVQGVLAPLAMKPVIANASKVVASLGKPGVAVVDARDRKFYDGSAAGGMSMKPHKRGHIKGALSIPYDSVFDDQHRLRPADDLRARFTQAGVKPGDTVIGYCHIGQQATAMLFAARSLGHPVLLYDGSFEDWSLHHPAYPVEAANKPTSTPVAQ